MTATVERPPHIDPRRWYDPRVSWRARQQASDEWKRVMRPIDVTYADHASQKGSPAKTTTEELIERVPQLFAMGLSATDISAELRLGLEALERRFRKADRPDLALPFSSARNAMRRTPCPKCGRPSSAGHTCARCAGNDIKVREDEKCANGHKWTPESTYVRPEGRRQCRTCQRDRRREIRTAEEAT